MSEGTSLCDGLSEAQVDAVIAHLQSNQLDMTNDDNWKKAIEMVSSVDVTAEKHSRDQMNSCKG